MTNKLLAGAIVFFGVCLLVVAGIGYMAVSKLTNQPIGPDSPTVDTVIYAQAKKVVADDETGLADDFLYGQFSCMQRLGKDHAYISGKHFQSYLMNMVKMLRHTEYVFDDDALEKLIVDPFESITVTGPMSDADYAVIAKNSALILEALEAID